MRNDNPSVIDNTYTLQMLLIYSCSLVISLIAAMMVIWSLMFVMVITKRMFPTGWKWIRGSGNGVDEDGDVDELEEPDMIKTTKNGMG